MFLGQKWPYLTLPNLEDKNDEWLNYFEINYNDILSMIKKLNPLLHNVEKWPNIILKSCGVHTARF